MRYIKILFLFTIFLFSTEYIKAQACITPPVNGSDDQKVCINSPIVDIIYTLAPSVIGASAIGLPTGVIGVFTTGQFRISGTPINSGTFSYTVTVVTLGLCTGGNTAPGKITVNPQPVPTITGPVSACVNASGNVYTTQSGMSNYTWTISAGGTITAGGGINNRTVTITWITAGVQTVSVNYANSDGCTATLPTIYNVTVNPLPVPALTGPAAACLNATGNVYTTDPGMSNYAWIVSGGTITAGGGANNNTATITWTSAGTRSVSINYVNPNGCTAVSPTVLNVTVNPLPVPTITGPITACINSTGNVYTTEDGMSNYIWAVSSGGTITSGGGTTNNTATITWTAAGPRTVSVRYTNSNGCAAASATVFNVTVNALPVVDAGPNVTIPNGTSTTLNGTVTGTGPFTYSWTPAAQLVNPLVVDPITVILSSTTVFTLTATSTTTTCSNSDVVTITIAGNPLSSNPTATPSTVCAGATVRLNAGATGGSGTYTYSWTSVPSGFTSTISNPVVNPLVTTTYRVAVFDGFTTVNAQVIVTVNALPVATASNNSPVCVGATLSLTGGPAGMLAYSWSGPNGYSNATMSPVVSTNTTVAMAGVYYLTVINSSGCQSIAASTTVTVNASPVATAANNGPVCVGSPLRLTGGPSVMTSYSWTGPNSYTSNVQSPTVSLTATSAMAGKYILTVVNAGGCQDTASTKVVVNTLPAVTAVNNGPVCSGKPLILTGGPASMASYLWTGPNSFTSTLQSPTVSLTSTTAMAGDYTLTVTNSTGCQSLANTTVVVNQIPIVTAANNGPVCVGSPLNLTGGPAGMATYSWSGPNGFTSTSQSPTVSASATTAMAGTYTLTVTNLNGCQGTLTTTVTVNALPVPTALNNGPVCVGSPLILAGGPLGMTTYSWAGPDGFTSNVQSPTVSLTATEAMAGTYTLTVTNSNGCLNSVSTVVIVNAVPVATAANNGPVCSEKPLILTGGPAGMTTYAWTGPNGFTSNLQSPTVSLVSTAAMAGTYSLTVTNNIGCKGIANTTVVINQTPVATAANSGPVCVGSPLNLTGGPAGMTTYSWAGPNGFTSGLMSPTVSASATLGMAGVYTLKVTNASDCPDTATTRVYVYTVPVSNAGAGGTECDLNFALNAIPSVGIGTWTMVTGPGTAVFTPNANSPSATVTVSAYGTYTFRWTETNVTCISSSVVTVNFYQQPLANAGTGGDECDLNYVLNAVPSIGIGTWTMTSGTGTAIFTPGANSPSATVVVSEYGTKEFTWIEANGQCADTSVVTVNFYQQPIANAGSGGNNCGLDFNLRSVPSFGTGTWTMDSGPGSATFSPDANSFAAKVTVTTYGIYVFRWTEVNGTCSNSSTVSVTFFQQPSANGGPGGDECDLNFGLNAVPGTGIGTWSKVSGPGNATFSDVHQSNATVTVSQFGAYDFAWTEANSLCTSSDIIRVTFHDAPVVNAGADVLLCKGSSIQLSASGTGSFVWSPASPLNNPNIYNPVASPDATTTFTVNLTDPWGCKNSDQVNVEVRIQPVANAGPDQELDFTFETNMQASALGTNQTGVWTLIEGVGDISDIHSPISHVSDLSLEKNSFLWTVTNGVCPESTDTVHIKVKNLIIPTLITPNLDGNNDYFVIGGIETIGKTSLTVFNRWGARVFEKREYDNSWDGVDDKENPLPEDTYFYVLKPEQGKTFKGYVVIKR
jgi:gliding motility-associated-like protein